MIFDQVPVGVVVSSLDGSWSHTNRSGRQMLGYDENDPADPTPTDPTHPADQALDEQFRASARAGEQTSLERDKRYVRRDGTVLWAHALSRVTCDPSGRPHCVVSFLQDLSDRRRADELLAQSERTLRAVIDNTPATISVKNLDHRYTLVNREFEQQHHTCSDQVLGRSDVDFLSSTDIEEVHARDREVLETGSSSQQETIARGAAGEQVLLVTRFPLRDEVGVIRGVCTASTDVTDQRRSELLRRERLECSGLIYAAMAEDRFVLHGQPILHLRSMKLMTTELLLRMRSSRTDPELLSPGRFLPAAERFDLIGVIDEWVIARAVGLAAGGHRVSVNLSAKTVSDSAQVGRIEALLKASPAAAHNVIFEITETAIAVDLDAAHRFSVRMRTLGCGVSLDDFGVGHGSFTYLRHLPVDYLKIDAQFVRDLLTDEEDRQVVQAIIGVARQFRIKTVAEGVEDEATLAALRLMGADLVQGYWTGRPVPLPEAWQTQNSHTSGALHVRPH
jgi:PAS domain S-box-containing protein